MSLVLNVEVPHGSALRPAIAEALQLSRKLDITVRLEFKGIPLEIHRNDEHDQIADCWERENRKRNETPTQI